MQTYELRVVERSVLANSADTTLVRTSIGIDQVHVLFDNAEWLDFPISATFTNASDSESRSTSLTVAEISGGVEFVAEATCVIPWEVIQSIGAIRVTFQGTNSDGDHIITAAGAPLSVVEAGDVAEGSVPAGAPTQSEWEQAYADAMSAINQLSSKLAEADAAIAAAEALEVPIATEDSAGIVQPDGTTTTVDENGVITCTLQPDLPIATTEVLGGVMSDGDTIEIDDGGVISVASNIADDVRDLSTALDYAFYATYDDEGALETATIKTDNLPIAGINNPGIVQVDGSTIVASVDGVIEVDSVPASIISGVIDPSNLPSYVDDVIEGYYYEGAFYLDAGHTTAITGELGKIYVDLSTDTSYRWSGSSYISISNPIDIATQAEAEAGVDNTKMMTPLRVKQAIDENAPTAATQSTDGLMSSTDKTKLDSIETGAQVNPGNATQSSDGLMSAADKAKLDDIEANANNYTLPTMSPTAKGGATVGDGLAVSGTALRATTRVETRQSGSDTYQVLVID